MNAEARSGRMNEASSPSRLRPMPSSYFHARFAASGRCPRSFPFVIRCDDISSNVSGSGQRHKEAVSLRQTNRGLVLSAAARRFQRGGVATSRFYGPASPVNRARDDW